MKNIVLMCCILLMTACTNTYHAVSNNTYNKNIISQKAYFVVNKNQKLEYQIFKKSERFIEASTPNDAISIHLNPLIHLPGCGNALFGSLVFLGTIPVSVPHNAVFSFVTLDDKKIHNFNLQAYSRVSIWEWFFKPFYSEASAYGKALNGATSDEDATPFYFP